MAKFRALLLTFALMVIVGMVRSAKESVKQKVKKKAQEAENRRLVNPVGTAPAKRPVQTSQARQKSQAKPQNRVQQVNQAPEEGEATEGSLAMQENQVSAEGQAKQEKQAKPAQPKVHVHLTPECPLDVELSGSLNYDSPEGRDICHEGQLRPVDQPLMMHEPEVEKPGMRLDLSPNAMLQAVIMQEVLQRPCQRRRR